MRVLILEKDIEAAVVRWARAALIMVTKLQGMGNRSWPDRIFWIKGGRPLMIEFKRPGGKLTSLQAMTINRLREDGYDVEVHESKLTAIAAVRHAMEAARVSGPRG